MSCPCFNEVKDYGNILLCGEEKTYTFIEAMIRICRNCFRTKRIHIGMDEAHVAQGTVLCVPVVCTLLWSIMHTLYRNLHTPGRKCTPQM